MTKLVVLLLCLLVAVACAGPVLEDEVFPKSYPVSLSGSIEGAGVPMGAERTCTNSLCLSLCRALGWPRGVCLDRNTCFCWR